MFPLGLHACNVFQEDNYSDPGMFATIELLALFGQTIYDGLGSTMEGLPNLAKCHRFVPFGTYVVGLSIGFHAHFFFQVTQARFVLGAYTCSSGEHKYTGAPLL